MKKLASLSFRFLAATTIFATSFSQAFALPLVQRFSCESDKHGISVTIFDTAWEEYEDGIVGKGVIRISQIGEPDVTYPANAYTDFEGSNYYNYFTQSSPKFVIYTAPIGAGPGSSLGTLHFQGTETPERLLSVTFACR